MVNIKNEPEKIILKLGGSLITKKDAKIFPLHIEEIKRHADEYIRYNEIKRICKEIKGAMDKKHIRLILVNGAGPFGHFLVKHNMPHEEVRASVRLLNEKLISELRKAGIDAVPIPPSESCEYVNGKFDISYLWEIGKVLLEEGKVLSTYGDAINGNIISGDDLIVLLAEQWQADKIITATDVDGVFTKDPKLNDDAKLIKHLSSDEDNVKVEYTINNIDVTGGMASKVKKLKQATKLGIKCQIINGLKEGNIRAVLLGDESIGTLILP